jgi:hypothetical protein
MTLTCHEEFLLAFSSSSKFVRVQQKSRDIETTDDGRMLSGELKAPLTYEITGNWF